MATSKILMRGLERDMEPWSVDSILHLFSSIAALGCIVQRLNRGNGATTCTTKRCVHSLIKIHTAGHSWQPCQPHRSTTRRDQAPRSADEYSCATHMLLAAALSLFEMFAAISCVNIKHICPALPFQHIFISLPQQSR